MLHLLDLPDVTLPMAGNVPARLAHLDHGDQRAVRIEGSEGLAQDAISAPPLHSTSTSDSRLRGELPTADLTASQPTTIWHCQYA